MYIKELLPYCSNIGNDHFKKYLYKNISKTCYSNEKNFIKDIKKLLPNSIVIKFDVQEDKTKSNDSCFIAFHHYENPFTIAIATYSYIIKHKLFGRINYMNVITISITNPLFKKHPLTSFIYYKKYIVDNKVENIYKFKYIKKLYQNIKKIQEKEFTIDNYQLSRNNFDLNYIYKKGGKNYDSDRH